MSLFSSAFPGRPAEVTHVFNDITALAESGVLFCSASSDHAFICDVGLYSVHRGTQFYYRQAYLAYPRSLEVYWDDIACLGWFLYSHSSRKVLDVPAREFSSTERNANDMQVKRSARAVPVEFKPGPQNTLEETCTAVRALYGRFSGFPDRSGDVTIVEDGIIKEGTPWNL